MKIFRKNKNQPRIRQTILPDDGKKSNPYMYYANRTPREGAKRKDIGEETQRPTSVGSRFSRVFNWAILILLLLITADTLWLNSTPTVAVQPSNGSMLLKDQKVYETDAEKLLNASFLNHLKISVDTSYIENQLQKEHPELASVSLGLPLFSHMPTLYVVAADPVLLLITPDGVYAADNGGVLIAQASPSIQKSLSKLNLPNVRSALGTLSVGQQALSVNDVTFIEYIDQEFNAQHVTVSEMDIVPNTREVDVRISGVGYFVKFNFEGDVKEQVGTYMAMRQYLQNTKVTPSQYIDVRVPGRAFYK